MLAETSLRTDSGRVLTVLYREHAADAFRYALHLTGRRADSEDIVQQVFLEAHRHLESGRELVSPRAWLLTAVKHRAFNLARDRREVPVDAVHRAEPRAASRDEAVELAEVRGMLWTLPEAQHHAFVLRHWSGLTQNEIAAVLETTPSAVESLLARARAALVRSQESASGACSAVRTRLLDSAALGATEEAHVGSCRPCRQARARLARAANLAGTLALVPGTHVADSIASLVPGFSAHAATSTTAAVGTTGAGAGAGGATTSLGATTAATTAGKIAVVAKTAVAVAAATAAVGSVPAAHNALSNLIARHSPVSAVSGGRQATGDASSGQRATSAVGAADAAEGVATDAATGMPPAEPTGTHGGTGKGAGKPAGAGAGKPADPGSQGGGKGLGDGGNGKAVGKPAGVGGGVGNAGGNGNGGGKPAGSGGGNANAGGNGTGNASGGGNAGATAGDPPAGAGGNGNGGGKPAGAGKP